MLIPLDIRCRNVIYNRKGPIILRPALMAFLPEADMEAQPKPIKTVDDSQLRV